MKHIVLSRVFALAIILLTARAPATAMPARVFPHPDRIRYDGQCLTIEGKDVFIYSGAFHFFRCPKELWANRFQKIKAAGFNCVETYVPWNWCERELPASLNDFSKVNLTDFDDFLTMAEQFGLYVIVRPGPYICAEWDTGGFPQWLCRRSRRIRCGTTSGCAPTIRCIWLGANIGMTRCVRSSPNIRSRANRRASRA